MNSFYINEHETYKHLKESYKAAKDMFSDQEVGIKPDKDCLLRKMIYIKGKHLNIKGITQTDAFVKIINEGKCFNY